MFSPFMGMMWLLSGLIFLTAPAQAVGLVTNSMLRQACESGRHVQQGYCEGYTMGVGEVMMLEFGRRHDLPPACVQAGADWPAVFEVMHPQVLERVPFGSARARSHVEAEWSRAYPCVPSAQGTVPRTEIFLDGHDLQARCASRRSRDRGVCQGYLVAVFERLSVAVDKGEDTEDIEDTQSVGCLPAGVTGSSLAKRVRARLVRIDEDDMLYAWLPDPAVDLIRRAVEDVWSRPQESCQLRAK